MRSQAFHYAEGWQAYLKAPDAEAHDSFGYSVAVSDTTLAIGAPGEIFYRSSTCTVNVTSDDCDRAGSAYVFTRTGSTWASPQTIQAPNAGAHDGFGHAIALSGNTLAVGAPGEGGSGAVFVFTRTGSAWDAFGSGGGTPGDGRRQLHTTAGPDESHIKAPSSDADDKFGHAVAIWGDTLAVGVPWEDSCSPTDMTNNDCLDSGAVYVFTRSGSTWGSTPPQYIKASIPAESDEFGWAVAISGDTLAVGAGFDSSCSSANMSSNGCLRSGAVYTFVRSGSSWVFEQYLKAPNVGELDEFGWAVALSGNMLAVGAPLESSCSSTDMANDGCHNSGAVYTFIRSPVEDGPHSNKYLAEYCSPAVTESTYAAAVAAVLATPGCNGITQESTLRYTGRVGTTLLPSPAGETSWLLGSTWVFEQFFKAPYVEPYDMGLEPISGDQFGFVVALSDTALAVGAWGEDSCLTSDETNNGCPGAGATTVFERAGSVWGAPQYVKARNAGAFDRFGCAVALSGDTLAVGAYGEFSCSTSVNTTAATDDTCYEAGAAYVFDRPCAGGSFPSPTVSTFYCEPCPSGSVQAAKLAIYQECTSCAAGTYQASTGQTACDSCPSGKYAMGEGNAECTDCPAGRHQPLEGQSLDISCLYCDAGKFSSVAGSATCTACPADAFAGVGDTECTRCFTGFNCTTGQLRTCGAGTYSSYTQDTSTGGCLPCPPGHRCPGASDKIICGPGSRDAPELGYASCVNCPAGKYQNETGQLDCRACVPGSYCPAGASAPLPCDAGRYSSATNLESAEQCTLADAGFFAPTASTEQTPCAAGTVATSPGASSCTPCPAGKYQNETGQLECRACAPGSYCFVGASVELACRAGTYQSQSGSSNCESCPPGLACAAGCSLPVECEVGSKANAASNADVCELCPAGEYQDQSQQTSCNACSAGYSCAQGAAQMTPCAKGSFTNASMLKDACELCPAGKYQAATGQTECDSCVPGSYCAVGAAAALPCYAGTYSNATDLSSAVECTVCPPGAFCVAGSRTPTNCSAGSMAANEHSPLCITCPEGSYQDDAGASACKPCIAMHTCPLGSSAPMPASCPAGHFARADFSSVDDCDPCRIAHFCFGGAAQAEPCGVGTFANDTGLARCHKCPGGSYQPTEGSSSCLTCPTGHWCNEGATTPIPCPAGTVSNATSLASEAGCEGVAFDFWAPLGSSLPEPCPASGFYCPGAAEDDINEPPGSRPIIIPVGGSIAEEEVEVIEQQMTLDVDLLTFNETSFRRELAALYGVDPSLIEVATSNATGAALPTRRRLGSTVISITIAVPVADAASMASVASVQALMNDPSTRQSLEATTGLTITAVGVTTTSVQTRSVETVCPAGHWCTAGRTVACLVGYYNPVPGALNQTACIRCPDHARTVTEGATSIEDCICDAEYYDIFDGQGIQCALCPSGAQCEDRRTTGISLSTLPVKRGYYRHSNSSVDVRRCPDAAVGCADKPECAESKSGCRGTVDGGAPCYPELTGVFCRECAVRNDGKVAYYKPADDRDRATCKACEDTLGFTLGIGSCTLLVLALIGSLLHRGYHLIVSPQHRAQFSAAWRTFAPLNKLKLIIGGAMITTKISSVYDVEFPAQIQRLLSYLSMPVDIGLSDIVLGITPLTCLGLDGYPAKLLFFLVAPAVLALGALLATFVWLHIRAHLSRASGLKWEVVSLRPNFGNEIHSEELSYALLDKQEFTFEQIQEFNIRRLRFNSFIQVGAKYFKPTAKEPFSATRLILEATPWVLRLLFFAYPLVTNVAFDAFPCHKLAEGDFLKADVSIQCGSSQHDDAISLAWAAIAIYPIGLLALSAALLYRARKAILSHQPTAFAVAIGFLYKEYDVLFFWWELIEMLRRLVLVGLMVVVESGRMMQLAIATMLAIMFLFFQLMASPYSDSRDNFLASTTSFSIVLCFLCAVFFKYAALVDLKDIQDKMSPEQRDVFILESKYVALTVILGLSIFASLIASVGIFAVNGAEAARRAQIAVRSAKARRLRYLKDGKEATLRKLPELREVVKQLHPNMAGPLPHAGPFHIFLSHNWKHGQSEMRIIKTRLLEMLPDVSVFLDVDNHGGGKDFPHIDVSDFMLCYLSELWFWNPPCLREIVRAMVRKKPLIALLEPDTSEQHGGNYEAKCREILLSKEYSDKMERVMGPQVEEWAVAWDQPSLRLPTGQEIVAALFERQPAVVWYRLADFQDISMRLIAERLLPDASEYQVASKYEQVAYMKGEVVQQVKGQLVLPAVRADCRFHLFLSPSSPGGDAALSIAEELKAFLPTLTWTTDVAQLPSCEHMVVLLTDETWTRGRESDAFAHDVCEAMRKGVHRWLVHEVVGARLGDSEVRHATSFENLIGATPKHIRDAKLYNEIAMNMGGGEWRESGLAKMAKQLCKGSGTRKEFTFEPDEPDDLPREPLRARTQDVEMANMAAREPASPPLAAMSSARLLKQAAMKCETASPSDMGKGLARVPALSLGRSFSWRSSSKTTSTTSAAGTELARAPTLAELARAPTLPQDRIGLPPSPSPQATTPEHVSAGSTPLWRERQVGRRSGEKTRTSHGFSEAAQSARSLRPGALSSRLRARVPASARGSSGRRSEEDADSRWAEVLAATLSVPEAKIIASTITIQRAFRRRRARLAPRTSVRRTFLSRHASQRSELVASSHRDSLVDRPGKLSKRPSKGTASPSRQASDRSSSEDSPSPLGSSKRLVSLPRHGGPQDTQETQLPAAAELPAPAGRESWGEAVEWPAAGASTSAIEA